MSMFFSEAAWFCLAVTAALGSIVLCKHKSPGQLGSPVFWLAGLCGGAYLLILSFFWSLVLFSLSCFLMCMYSADQELLPVDQKAVLVTGCDSGFGHALVKNLDKLGFTVFAGVLNEKSSGAEELRRNCSKHITVLQMDITNPEQIKDAHSKVVEKVQDKGGVPMPKMAAYNPTKAALTMFSSIMRQELSTWGVKVSVVQPGGFQTNIAGTSDVWAKKEKDIVDHLSQEQLRDYGQDYLLLQKNFVSAMVRHCSPDYTPVLRDIQHAISSQSPAPFYTPGTMVSLWLCFASFFPTCLFDYCVKKLIGQDQGMPRALRMPN
ncbi:PREDICTED: estradiol 17-beta-dehydrogenase 2 isoform X3 [Chinchilla lanigera]|uniref:estradiol 17-beta-dehydrogenase 2 isoform X3 n=1 Tax=Chinchilla lanigera TaxID=34839 RepID=UPI0006987E9D|nr:PREDICTED: estradiol 17-beta-dehydrogenase 2 isoform X3 [Chinchilla lanigera]